MQDVAESAFRSARAPAAAFATALDAAAEDAINGVAPVDSDSLQAETEGKSSFSFRVTYSDYVELICQHPIIEMMMSQQFQGLIIDKMNAMS